MLRLLHTLAARLALCLSLCALAVTAQAQYGGGRPGTGSITGSGQGRDVDTTPPAEPKPDKVAAKAYAAGMKSLAKARELEDTLGKTTDADKKSALMEKLGDAYGRALDQFTEVLRNNSAMYDAWTQVGFVHFRLGAYRESIDDYNHGLTLKPDQPVAIMYRAEAYMNLDRLDEAKSAYTDLSAHAPPQAEELYTLMQRWVTVRRAAPNGMRASDIDAFDAWLKAQPAAKTAAAGAAP